MKKLRLISFVLVIALVLGVFAGCKKKSKYTENQVVWLVVGTEAADTPRVLDEFNKMLKEKTGLEVVFKYIDNTQYDLQFSSDEEFDLVVSPDSMGYWTNAEKGAFMKLTEDDFKKYAPFIWKNGKKFLDAGKYAGEYYAIPGIKEFAPDRVLVARGDLMDKYGIEALDTVEDIDEYVMAVANDPTNDGSILAFNAPGKSGWMLFNMFASDWGWGAVGTLSFGEHIYYDTDEDYQKLFAAIDMPETRDYSLRVKKWYDAGVFSKSVLSNETTSEESFKVGKSALAWTSNPASANNIYKELQKDERTKGYDVRFYSMYARQQRMFNFMNSACSISAKSTKKEQALKVLNAIYSDAELYNLFTYGEEGVHYNVTDNGFELIDTKEEYWSPGAGVSTTMYDFPVKYEYDYAEDLVAELKGKSLDDPLVNCPVFTDSEITIIDTKLTEVFNEYSTPRLYGAVADVDKAIEDEKKALKAGGIDAFLKHNQKCVDKYVKDYPEAIARYEESKKAVAKWNKDHPTKTKVK